MSLRSRFYMAKVQSGVEYSTVVKKQHAAHTEIHYFCLPDIKSNEIKPFHVKPNSAGYTFQPNIFKALVLNGPKVSFSLSKIGIAQNNIEYTTSIPLLEEHEKILSFIWNEIQKIVTSGRTLLEALNIVTGGRTFRALAMNAPGAEFTLKINKKGIYILNYKRKPNTNSGRNNRRLRAYATVMKNNKEKPHSTYSYNKIEVSGCIIHYTSEEDVLYDGEFYEIKMLDEGRNRNHKISADFALDVAIQCMTRQSKKVVFGFYNNKEVILKLLSHQKLIEIAGKEKYETAERMLKINLNAIIQYIKANAEKISEDETVNMKVYNGIVE